MGLGLIANSGQLVGLLDEATERWHGVVATGAMEEVDEALLRVHRANFELWHEEDEARNPGSSDERIAGVKRAIDRINQRRNDLVEALDVLLSGTMQQNVDSPLHSETPGMMVDRLSILSLKVFHTREEIARRDAGESHREKNQVRLAVLIEQREDLAGCLDRLIVESGRGERRFKVYRQMKMYNDPELNPVLYRREEVDPER